jgi:hypothetical protein
MPPLRRRGIMPDAAHGQGGCQPVPLLARVSLLRDAGRPDRAATAAAAPWLHRNPRAPRATMFLFFSNKLGWGKSIAISVVLTVLLLLLLGVF